jgi:hypothetical protein
MSPKKHRTKPGGVGEARNRRIVAEKYLEAADLIALEDGAAINVCVGLAVLAGIAAGDAICLSATGERYAGQDHAAAADLLSGVNAQLGKRLHTLVGFKPASHYGAQILSSADRTAALRSAQTLVEAARTRTT